jgi:hypothetical protein
MWVCSGARAMELGNLHGNRLVHGSYILSFNIAGDGYPAVLYCYAAQREAWTTGYRGFSHKKVQNPTFQRAQQTGSWRFRYSGSLCQSKTPRQLPAILTHIDNLVFYRSIRSMARLPE